MGLSAGSGQTFNLDGTVAMIVSTTSETFAFTNLPAMAYSLSDVVQPGAG